MNAPVYQSPHSTGVKIPLGVSGIALDAAGPVVKSTPKYNMSTISKEAEMNAAYTLLRKKISSTDNVNRINH